MAENVIRFPDIERRSRDADAVPLRDPADCAAIIVLPVIRIERVLPMTSPDGRFGFIPGTR